MPATRPRLVWLAAGALLLLTGVYQAKGNLDLVWGTTPGSAVDLLNRDREQDLFARGENPFDHNTGSQPPWGYPTGVLFTWPAGQAVRPYFAILNAAALLVVMWWASRAAPSGRPEERWLLMAAAGAFGGSCTATEVGQVGIVVTALLCLSLWADERGHDWWAGVLVGLALIKPTISAPFAVALLLTGRWKASLAAAAYGAAASLVTWAVTDTAPWHMLGQLARAAGTYSDDGTLGLVEVLAPLDVPAALRNPIAALLVTVPGVLLMFLVRGSLPLAFAVAAVWGRLWTYHKSYDDVMLVFLLVPLAAAALRRPALSLPLVIFGLMGVLAWVPGRILALDVVQGAQLIAWPVALAVVLAHAHAGRRAVPASS
jgi:hypothetical protein